MKSIMLFAFLLIGLVNPAYGAEEPCAKEARSLFQLVTGRAPGQFGLSSSKYNAWADATEYVYVAANGVSSAYVMEYFLLDGRKCFLNSMRFDGDL